MAFQKTKPADLDTPGVGGVAHPKLESKAMIQPTRICPNCGTAAGAPSLPGSGWIEAFLWVTTIFFGLFYSIWRRTKKSGGCPTCGAPTTIPLDTPAGKNLAMKYHGGTVNPIEPPPPVPVSPVVAIGLLIFAAFMLYSLSR